MPAKRSPQPASCTSPLSAPLTDASHAHRSSGHLLRFPIDTAGVPDHGAPALYRCMLLLSCSCLSDVMEPAWANGSVRGVLKTGCRAPLGGGGLAEAKRDDFSGM
eukprot:2432337-Alexandrium_andersonii.AAC.1